jgi:hypothetical protein
VYLSASLSTRRDVDITCHTLRAVRSRRRTALVGLWDALIHCFLPTVLLLNELNLIYNEEKPWAKKL